MTRLFRCCLIATIVGCGSSTPRPLASEEISAAEAELRAGLDAWRKGEAAPRHRKRPPAVDFVDPDWQAGARLTGYEILKIEGVAGENARAWVVLTLVDRRGAATPREVVYEINLTKKAIGRDPFN